MSDSLRPTEMAVMALLEQVIVEAERAQRLVQDDGRVTDENDRRAIKDHVMRIRALVMDVEKALGTKILTDPPPARLGPGPEYRPTKKSIRRQGR